MGENIAELGECDSTTICGILMENMDHFEGPLSTEYSSSDLGRKTTKPLMEKKRRARINKSLEQLKSLVLDALKKDSIRYSKLEKADILEMTVKHLRHIQRQQITADVSYDPKVISKYGSGFNECAHEVDRYLASIDGLRPQVRMRLMHYLRSRYSANLCSSTARMTSSTLGSVLPGFRPHALRDKSNTIAFVPLLRPTRTEIQPRGSPYVDDNNNNNLTTEMNAYHSSCQSSSFQSSIKHDRNCLSEVQQQTPATRGSVRHHNSVSPFVNVCSHLKEEPVWRPW